MIQIDIDMPKNCFECDKTYKWKKDGKVQCPHISMPSISSNRDCRPSYCPLKENDVENFREVSDITKNLVLIYDAIQELKYESRQSLKRREINDYTKLAIQGLIMELEKILDYKECYKLKIDQVKELIAQYGEQATLEEILRKVQGNKVFKWAS